MPRRISTGAPNPLEVKWQLFGEGFHHNPGAAGARWDVLDVYIGSAWIFRARKGTGTDFLIFEVERLLSGNCPLSF